MTRNSRHIFSEVPQGYPIPGRTTVQDTSATIDLDKVPLNGGILIKTLALSIDPYQRGRMRDASVKSYSPPYAIGEPITNAGLGVVLRSESSSFKAGDHVNGPFTFEEYVIVKEPKDSFRVVINEHNLPWTVFLGVLGMPGMTAYCGWKEYSQVQQGDIVFVTAGAGPVGSLVIQLAKQDGLKVIASAGSEEKVQFLKDIGADVAFNYKTVKTHDILNKEGPINIYWDNVGGETLEAAIDAAASGARFIECGMIESYNNKPYYIKNLTMVVSKQLKISGFLVGALREKYKADFFTEIEPKVANGKIHYREDLTHGLENSGQAILDVQQGKNKGKSVVVVAEE